MSKKTSIWISETIRRLADDRLAEGGSFSGLISTVADRYQAMVARSLPTLARDEWGLIFEALNGPGTDFDGRRGAAEMVATHVWANVADFGAGQVNWAVDVRKLVKRLQGMSYCQLLAIQDAAERFWAHADASTIESVVGDAHIASLRAADGSS